MPSRFRLPRHYALALLTATLIFSQLGCASTIPRQHWWEFWRPKKAKTQEGMDPLAYGVPDENAGLGDDMSATRLSPDGTPELTPLEPGTYEGYMDQPTNEPLRQGAAEAQQLRTVHFGFDRYDLDDTARATLDANAEWIARNPGLQIQIEGHTDERGTNEYNLLLGERRAKSVKAYLMTRGVADATLHTISYGEERPLQPESNEEAWALNRRAQFLAY